MLVVFSANTKIIFCYNFVALFRFGSRNGKLSLSRGLWKQVNLILTLYNDAYQFETIVKFFLVHYLSFQMKSFYQCEKKTGWYCLETQLGFNVQRYDQDCLCILIKLRPKVLVYNRATWCSQLKKFILYLVQEPGAVT